MSDNSFDPIRDRLSKILRDAQPAYGSHLADEEILALAVQKPGPGDPLPDHLRTCAWCCRRVFEARHKVAMESARPRRMSLPIAILRDAVHFLKAPPGTQSAYAFFLIPPSPPPASEVSEMRLLPRYTKRKPHTEQTPDGVDRVPETPRSMPVQSSFVVTNQWLNPPVFQSISPPAPSTEAIPLAIEGLDGHLIVLRGELCMMTLYFQETGTGKPLPGITVRLKGESKDWSDQTNEEGMAYLVGMPEGRYTLEVVFPRT